MSHRAPRQWPKTVEFIACGRGQSRHGQFRVDGRLVEPKLGTVEGAFRWLIKLVKRRCVTYDQADLLVAPIVDSRLPLDQYEATCRILGVNLHPPGSPPPKRRRRRSPIDTLGGAGLSLGSSRRRPRPGNGAAAHEPG